MQNDVCVRITVVPSSTKCKWQKNAQQIRVYYIITITHRLHATVSCSAHRNGILNLYICSNLWCTISPLLYAKLFCSVVMAGTIF